MKLSLMTSVYDDRRDMFARFLATWAKQTVSNDNFKMVIVDD